MKALSHRKQQKGAVLILVTVALFVLLAFTALALDGGYLILNKNRLQDAVDSAALSGAKTLASPDITISTHDEAEKVVHDTIRTIMQGDGFKKMQVDTTKLAEAVVVEFSEQPVPFVPTANEDAKYIRVRMETVPVTQFFSQLLVDNWQVRASAVAGTVAPQKGNKICDVVPLLMLIDEDDLGKPGFGYNMADNGNPGDIIVIKSPAAGSPNMAPGNFQAISLDGQAGADRFRDGLAGGHCIELDHEYDVEECAESNNNCSLTKVDGQTGNIAGPTRQGLNTRFNIYNPGKFKEPTVAPEESSPGDENFYSDCVLSSADVLDFKDNQLIGYINDLLVKGSTTKNEIVEHLEGLKSGDGVTQGDKNKIDGYISKVQGMQIYSDYTNPQSSSYDPYVKKGNSGGCLNDRRIIKVPVAVGGDTVGKTIDVVGVSCMFLNQQVTGNGLSQYIVAELIPDCGADGSGASDGSGFTQPRLVLFNDSASGDS